MRKFLIFYYDGNNNHVAIIEDENMWSACEKLGDKLPDGQSWAESVNYMMDISHLSDLDCARLKVFNNNGGAGQDIDYSDIQVIQ